MRFEFDWSNRVTCIVNIWEFDRRIFPDRMQRSVATKKKWSGVKRRRVDPIQRLKKDVSRIKKSQELKWHDVILTSATGGQVEPLNNVPLGDDATTRDGRKIMMTAITCHGNVGNTGGTSPCPRYAIVYDVSPNGALPPVTDIFTSSVAASFTNLNNQKRFKVLWDNFGGLGQGRDPFNYQNAINENGSFIWNDYIKLRNLITMYKDTGSGTMAGTSTGALYAVFLGSGSTTTADIRFRIRYFDS